MLRVHWGKSPGFFVYLTALKLFLCFKNMDSVKEALALANRAFQFYIVSDVCIKDLTYDEMYLPLKQLVCLLQHASNITGDVVCTNVRQ